MSLRIESLRAYRQLHRAVVAAAAQCLLCNQDGLQRYVSRRFVSEAEQNRQRVATALRDLETQGCQSLASARVVAGQSPRRLSRAMEKRQQKLLRQYEQYISRQVDRTCTLAAMLAEAAGNPQLTSLLQVLAAGIGNASYQRMVESSFEAFFAFEKKRAARDEATEEATSERQNRIMQQAVLPYGERLLLVHRTAIGEGNRSSSLSYLSPWQVTESIVGTRSGVSAHHVRVGRDHVVVEVDETFNKQVVYICCARSDGSNLDSGSYDWDQEVERIDISESEEVRQTMFHAEFLLMATRLCDALTHETPLHPTRKTVVVGHAVGGAVGVIVALLLSQRGFEVNNVITFGAPKSMQHTLDRYVAAINPIRVVLAGDPLVELPVTGAEGDPFEHIGEILLMSPRQKPDETEAVEEETANTPNERTAGASSGKTNYRTRGGDSADLLSAEGLAAGLADDATAENAIGGTRGSLDIGNNSNSYRSLDTEQTENACNDDDYGVNDGTDAAEGAETEAEVEADEDEADLRNLCRIAEERYRKHFLVEDYVRHLADQTVELTYAEGDEVWDEGEYAASTGRDTGAAHVSAGEQQRRDLRGAL